MIKYLQGIFLDQINNNSNEQRFYFFSHNISNTPNNKKWLWKIAKDENESMQEVNLIVACHSLLLDEKISLNEFHRFWSEAVDEMIILPSTIYETQDQIFLGAL